MDAQTVIRLSRIIKALPKGLQRPAQLVTGNRAARLKAIAEQRLARMQDLGKYRITRIYTQAPNASWSQQFADTLNAEFNAMVNKGPRMANQASKAVGAANTEAIKVLATLLGTGGAVGAGVVAGKEQYGKRKHKDKSILQRLGIKESAYLQGFETACVVRGVTPEQLVQLTTSND